MRIPILTLMIGLMLAVSLSTESQAQFSEPFDLAKCRRLVEENNAADGVEDEDRRRDREGLIGHRAESELRRTPGIGETVAPRLQTSVDLTAGEKNGRGVMTYAGQMSTSGGRSSSWALTASVPFDKSKAEGTFLTVAGIGGDIVLKGERTWFQWMLSPARYGYALCDACQEVGITNFFDCSIEGLKKHLARPSKDPPLLDPTVIERIDREVGEKADQLRAKLGEACSEVKGGTPELDCGISGIALLWREEAIQAAERQALENMPPDARGLQAGVEIENRLTELLFGKVAGTFWGIDGSVGSKERNYFELDGTKKDENRTGYSASILGGLALQHGAFYARVIGKRDFKENPKSQKCSEVESSELVTCEEQPLGRANEVDSLVVSLELRRLFEKVAISPSVAYDFEIEEWAAQFPIYLVRNNDGAFTGGLKLLYGSENDEFSAAVFVSKAFSF